ncbi:hypothetical protein QBC47DRAFT_360152 [Echria macrotheca]|uniref:Uncharacterized protein n=1 Tax=Echria macrotheca TaxID=438768 RepID=A0AAJ0BDX2_9PEZI|nr:hypothetical protein QBC47DRAFT_360152 [Echria macrotheca]
MMTPPTAIQTVTRRQILTRIETTTFPTDINTCDLGQEETVCRNTVNETPDTFYKCSPDPPSGTGLSTASIVGIVISLAVLLVILWIVWRFFRCVCCCECDDCCDRASSSRLASPVELEEEEEGEPERPEPREEPERRESSDSSRLGGHGVGQEPFVGEGDGRVVDGDGD